MTPFRMTFRGDVTRLAALFLFFFLPLSIAASGDEIEQKLVEMTFETEAHGWRAERHCRAFLENGVLRIEAVDGMPILSRFVDEIGGQIQVTAEIRTLTESSVNAYWTTRGTPRRSEEKMISLPLKHDGQWHSYQFPMPIPDYLTSFTFRFTAPEGVWEIRKLTVVRKRTHPIRLRGVVPYDYEDPDGNSRKMLRYTIYNDAPVPLKFRVGKQTEDVDIAGHGTVDLLAPIRTEGNLAAVNVLIRPNDFPEVGFPVFLYDEKGHTDWIVRPLGTGKDTRILEVAPNGRMARLRQGENVFAVIAPIVHRQGVIPDFQPLAGPEEPLLFESENTKLEIRVENASIRFLIESKSSLPGERKEEAALEGPVVRLFGKLQSGLLPGVEFLGPGDVGSSTIDIEEPYNRRSTPNRLWVTMPLAVLATDRGALSLRWNDKTLQPTFASPNDFDRTDDHRMSLLGRTIDATLDFIEPNPSGEESASLQALRRYVADHGFPEPPPAPRDAEQQARLSLRGLQGELRSEDGTQWGYALEPQWPRKPFADMLSNTVRLLDLLGEERLPRPGEIVSGGADIANDTIYFLNERVEQWRSSREEAIRSILTLRNPDGSFLHRTRFPEIETAVTSHGYTAVRALEIMEFVRLTGSRELFEVVRDSMEYLRHCDVPRGAFYRSDPLHTPDLLTAASLTWLYVWAFEFSGETDYLELARRYAHAGLPFVYQWSERDTMLYVTVPKLGGTERRLPLWFGVSQPRIGLVYAYALNLLARHDPAVDWRRVAVGILHATEAMQYTEGAAAGCLPEAFDVAAQERRSWHVNPCALISLRSAVDGRADSLCLLLDETDRYVSPYPLRLTPAGIESYDVPQGRKFQVLRNGNRILTVVGSGPLRGE